MPISGDKSDTFVVEQVSTVSGIPVGDTLSDGTKSFTASAGATSVNVLGWNYGSLTIMTVNDRNIPPLIRRSTFLSNPTISLKSG